MWETEAQYIFPKRSFQFRSIVSSSHCHTDCDLEWTVAMKRLISQKYVSRVTGPLYLWPWRTQGPVWSDVKTVSNSGTLSQIVSRSCRVTLGWWFKKAQATSKNHINAKTAANMYLVYWFSLCNNYGKVQCRFRSMYLMCSFCSFMYSDCKENKQNQKS